MTRMDSVERKKMPGRARGALKAVCLGLVLGALAAVAGCQSYTIVQRNIFSDEDKHFLNDNLKKAAECFREQVIQEDDKLLMYYDLSLGRV